MKKAIVILTAAIVLAITFSSCGSSKKCPAYSQIQTQQVHGRV